MAITYGKNYGRPTLDLNFAENKSLIDSVTGRNLITFSRSQSGKEATYVGSDGLIKYAGADEPRFDYNPVSGVCKGLLIEESRTNLTKYSEFQTTWGTFNTTISHNYSSPDGQSNAILLAEALTNQAHYLNRADVSVNAGTTYCLSVYYKKGTGATAPQWIELSANAAGFGLGTNFTSTFDIENGVKGSAGASIIDFNIIDTGNGWYRCWMTATATQTSSTSSLVIKFNNNQSTPQGYGVYTGQTTSNVFVFGAQVEAGSFPTSYIPTSGSTVTRNPDNASITGTNFSSWYNQSEGTIFAGVSSFSYNNSATLPTFAHFTDGSLNNYIRLNSGPAYLVRNFTNTGGVTQTQAGVNIAPANNSPYSIALGLTTNNARIYADGNPAALIIPYSPPVVNKVEIGNWIAQNNTWTNGHISRLTYWPKRLPDLELQQLTK